MSIRLACVVVAACGSAAAPVSNTHAPATETLEQALLREVGGGSPVAMLPGAAGLRAVSADGAHEKIVVPGGVAWVLVDQRTDVVWFGDGAGTVSALDLAAPTAQPRVVVTGLAAATAVGIAHGGDFADLTYGHLLEPRAVLVVAAEPALRAVPGLMATVAPENVEPFEDAVAKAKIVDKPFVAAVARRGAKRSASLGEATSDGTLHVLTGYDPTACQDASICGRAELVPGTKLWRVIVEHGCGDGCYVTWQLYDPEERRYLAGDWTRRAADAWVARDGSAFVTRGAIYRFDRGVVAAASDEIVFGGGWLGGAYYLGN